MSAGQDDEHVEPVEHDAPPGVDTSVPSSPRVWNYLLGGKDNFAIDRQVGDAALQAMPQMAALAVATRRFLVRAVSTLAGECGVRQFLDVGTGLPTADNTHEVAQRVAPESRMVYVDNDPSVLAHARALLVSSPHGATAYLDEDLYRPQEIIEKARVSGILDFTRPIALTMFGILGHVEDWDVAKGIVAQLLAALPSGSYLATSDGTNVIDPLGITTSTAIYNETARPRYHLRTPDQISELYAGLELLEPGVVSVPLWRPCPADVGGPPVPVDNFGGVGRKP